MMAVIIQLSLCSCAENQKGEPQMIEKSLSQRLAETKVDDVQKIDSLAAEIRDKSSAQPAEVVRLAHSDSVDLQATASAVLQNLGPMAIPALLQALRESSPEDCVWDFQTAARLHLESRTQLVAALEKRLTDKRPIQIGDPFAVRDEEPAPRRVCDEAFSVLRRLLASKESAPEITEQDRLFLELSESARDQEIARFLESKDWLNLKSNPME
jgi:hypothetical protein